MIVKKIMKQTKESIIYSLKIKTTNWKVSCAFYLQTFRHNSDKNTILNVFLESRKNSLPYKKKKHKLHTLTLL